MIILRTTIVKCPWRSTVVAVFLLSATACASHTPPPPTLAKQVAPQCPEASDEAYYFPEGAISPQRSTDRSYTTNFSLYLKSFDAPSLSCGTAVSEGYRLLWVQGNRPAGTIAFSRRNEKWDLTVVEYVDPLRSRVRSVIRTRTNTPVTDQTAGQLATALHSGGFWTTLNSERSSANFEDIWVIEGRTETGYHVVTRPSLRDTTFWALGVPFFTAASLPLPERTLSNDKDLN